MNHFGQRSPTVSASLVVRITGRRGGPLTDIDGARENDDQSRELVSVDTSLILAKPVKDKKDIINLSLISIYKFSKGKQAFTFVAPAVLRLYRPRQSQRNGPTFKTTARGLTPPPHLNRQTNIVSSATIAP